MFYNVTRNTELVNIKHCFQGEYKVALLFHQPINA